MRGRDPDPHMWLMLIATWILLLAGLAAIWIGETRR